MPFHYVVNAGEDGHRVFYRVHGDVGAPHKVLFTMGLGGTTYHWEDQVRFFAARRDFCVCVYDNRGVGFSDVVAGRWTTRLMARDALSLLNHLGWQQNVHLVGLSMGGMVTQELALLDPPRFDSIALLSTIAGGPRSLYYFLTKLPTGVRSMAGAFLTTDPRAQLAAGLATLYPREHLDTTYFNEDKQQHEPYLAKYRRALVQRGKQGVKDGMPDTPLTTVFKQALAVATHRVPADALRRLSRERFQGGQRALVVTGDADILVHHGNATVLRDGLEAHFLLLPGAGHGANEQCAQEVNAALLANILGDKHQPMVSRL
jgi:pimeloyl-ACP methyl ester carboxylesterase